MRTDMAQTLEAKRSFKIAPALALTCLAGLALGGCQSPMYSGTPEDMSYAVAPTYSPGNPAYIGRNENAGEEPSEQAWTAERNYEYRGGRDPVSGRATTQM
jgi:hypothetical protein